MQESTGKSPPVPRHILSVPWVHKITKDENHQWQGEATIVTPGWCFILASLLSEHALGIFYWCEPRHSCRHWLLHPVNRTYGVYEIKFSSDSIVSSVYIISLSDSLHPSKARLLNITVVLFFCNYFSNSLIDRRVL